MKAAVPAAPLPGARLDAGTRFGLRAALGVSVLVHLVLALLLSGPWLRLLERHDPLPAERPLLRFSFVPPQPSDRPEQPPRGNVPDARRPAPAAPQVASAAPPSSSPAATSPPPAESARSGAPEVRSVAPEGDVGPRPSGAASDTGGPSGSVSRALSDWRRALEDARPRQNAPPGSGTHENVFVPDPGSFPVSGAPYGILEFSSRDYDWSAYSSQVYWAILKAWYRRLDETTPDFEKWAHTTGQWLLAHRTRIQFVIQRNGDVTGIAVETPAGCEPLDRSALDALSEVILPPLPADFPRDSERVHGTFIARGDISAMRQTFRYLKQINYF